MSDILLEVDDALRAQQLKALWDKYGQWLLGLMVAVVIATAIGVTWHHYTNKALSEQTAALLAILQDEAVKGDKTSAELAVLAKKADLPLRAVVALYHAQKLEQGGDLAAAQETYKKLAVAKSAPDIMRDLARVHYVRLGLAQTEPETDELLKMLKPVATKDGNFHASALEMKAMLLGMQGKTDEAAAIYARLVSDETAPPSIRARAKTMVGTK